jgi:hypothetical protein
MNLFSKKMAFSVVGIVSATFLMSFESNEVDYGKSIEVYNNEISVETESDAKVAPVARLVARAAVNAIAHLTPELEQISYTILGVTDVSTIEETQKTKLSNLD